MIGILIPGLIMKKAYYISKQDNEGFALVKYDIGTKTSEIRLNMESNFGFKLSNDEKKLLIKNSRQMYLYEIEADLLIEINMPDIHIKYIWSPCFLPDDKFAAFSYVYDDGSYLNSHQIWIMDFSTMRLEKIYEKRKASISDILW